MKTQCAICQQEKEITGFHRDDPIMECGHILTIDVQIMLETVNKLEEFCHNRVTEVMNELHIDHNTAEKMIVKEIFG